MKLKTSVLLFACAMAACHQPKQGVITLGSAHPLNGIRVYAMQVYRDKLFVGGEFDSAGGIRARNIATWDGTKWDSIGGGMRGYPFAFVNAFAVYKGELYAAGFFYNKTLNANGIEKWDGSTWSAVGKGVNVYGSIASLAEYNGNLYVTGDFDSIESKPAHNFAMWNGIEWRALPDSIDGGAEELIVYKNKLYALGNIRFKNMYYNDGLMTYDGEKWGKVNLGKNFAPTGMWVYNDELYLMGELDWKPFTGRWNGNSVTPVNLGIDGRVLCTIIYHDKLIVAGLFARAGDKQAHCIAKCDGTKSEPIPLGFNSTMDTLEKIRKTGFSSGQEVVDSMGNVKFVFSPAELCVSALAVYHNQLYVGGTFDSVNGKPITNIVSWYKAE